MNRYKIPANEATAKLTVKGSKFIGHIFHVVTKEEAEAKYNEVKKRFHDATHNCFAYRIDSDTFRYSDDGEPSGTAGRPILQVLEGQEVYEVLCVVTRYFGGTKLGTGGLIRAYGEAARLALNGVKIIEKIKTRTITVALDYMREKFVYRLLDQMQGRVVDSEYGDEVKMKLELPESKIPLFLKQLEDLTHGQLKIVQTH